MVAITDRCHACGAHRIAADRFCRGCGAPLPAVTAAPAKAAAFEQAPGQVAWPYRVPVLGNRYNWSKWGWATFWSWLIMTALGFGVMALFGASGSEFLDIGPGLAVGLAIFAGLVIVGLGLFGTMMAGNGVHVRYRLNDEGLLATGGVDRDQGESLLLMFTDTRNAETTADAARSLLPAAQARFKWSSVRRVQFDPVRRVITLRRRWHHPFRVYVPEGYFDQAAAFVAAHVDAAHGPASAATPPTAQASGT